MNVEDEIPPTLPLQKGGIPPLWHPFPVFNRQRGVRGDFYNNMSFQLWTP